MRTFDFEGQKWTATFTDSGVVFANGDISVPGQVSGDSPKVRELQASLDDALPDTAHERLMRKIRGK